MNDYIIAIPTYRRYEVLGQKTLKLLARSKIPIAKIILFVANQSEYSKYHQLYPDYKIVVGRRGLGHQMNFIIDYFPSGKQIVKMDDDIDNIIEKLPPKGGHNYKTANINQLINLGFRACKETGLSLWGVNHASNPFFLRDTISVDRKIIIGTVFGWINRHERIYKNKYNKIGDDIVDDIERSILYFELEGGVVRLNKFAVIHDYLSPDGIQALVSTKMERYRKSRAVLNRLKSTYPSSIDWIKKIEKTLIENIKTKY